MTKECAHMISHGFSKALTDFYSQMTGELAVRISDSNSVL